MKLYSIKQVNFFFNEVLWVVVFTECSVQVLAFYPKNFVQRITSQKPKPKPVENEPPQEKKISTIPYIKSTSEMIARLLREHNILVAHKPTNKLTTYFTNHKDKIPITEQRNAVYMFSCKNCPKMYIGQTSKKISTRPTEHQNAIQRHDHLSLPASHADDNGHKFDFQNIKLLGKAQTKEACEFIETWHSLDKSSFNRHIEIPSVYLQLKSKPNNQSKQSTDQTTKVMNRNITPSTSPKNASNTAGRINNDTITTAVQPIRRSQRIQTRTSAKNKIIHKF